tara:strand:+ start:134 stop:313 length:180 start_codon:yes stop_codon:yes gene_type:complete
MDNEQKRTITINKVDVLYRELENIDEQFLIMSKVLSFLTDKQLSEITKDIKIQIKKGNQ